MQKAQIEKSRTEPTKTFLVEYGIATVGMDGERENLHIGLVEAPNHDSAQESAIEDHCWEGFDEDDDGKPNGEWIQYQGHRAFQVSKHASDVDANSIYWVNKITEVPDEDVPILRKYPR